MENKDKGRGDMILMMLCFPLKKNKKAEWALLLPLSRLFEQRSARFRAIDVSVLFCFFSSSNCFSFLLTQCLDDRCDSFICPEPQSLSFHVQKQRKPSDTLLARDWFYDWPRQHWQYNTQVAGRSFLPVHSWFVLFLCVKSLLSKSQRSVTLPSIFNHFRWRLHTWLTPPRRVNLSARLQVQIVILAPN